MMTPEYAIECLEDEKKGIYLLDDRDLIDYCISIIEKQIPKKPIGDLHSVPHHRCPNCNSAIRVYDNSSFDLRCKFCGQAIDWSDEE